MTWAEQLGTGSEQSAVQVIEYPNSADASVQCTNSVKLFSPAQLELDCDGYAGGVSGGPFLTGVSSSGLSTVIGVIGGCQQGGDAPGVSATAFGAGVQALFHTAEAAD